jgi:hypothetical protein
LNRRKFPVEITKPCSLKKERLKQSEKEIALNTKPHQRVFIALGRPSAGPQRVL